MRGQAPTGDTDAGALMIRLAPREATPGTVTAPNAGSEATWNGHTLDLTPGATQAALTLPEAPATHPGYAVLQRALDLALGTTLLILTLVVIVLLAVLVRRDSPGPVIFKQRRVGEGGKLFTFYKFRTMSVDARERFPELYAYRYSDQEVRTMYFKLADDPRLTPFGRYLRKTSLDELPNLVNVLRGDMSLVGPRPEIPEMLRYYRPEQLVKFSVKPGVTGLAQVTGRGMLSFQQTVAADVEGCRHRSFWFDLRILVRTVKCVFLRVGAF